MYPYMYMYYITVRQGSEADPGFNEWGFSQRPPTCTLSNCYCCLLRSPFSQEKVWSNILGGSTEPHKPPLDLPQRISIKQVIPVARFCD